MPNWCNNEMKIEGKVAEVKAIRKFLKGAYPQYAPRNPNEPKEPIEKSVLCFNKVIPIPPETLAAGYDGHEREGKNLPLDGYHWQSNNWGTKWSPAEVSSHLETSKDKKTATLTYQFDTAWGPSVPVSHKLGELFPSVTITHLYAEPGMGFAGKEVIQGTNIDSDAVEDSGFRDFVTENFGYDPYEDEEENSTFEEVEK